MRRGTIVAVLSVGLVLAAGTALRGQRAGDGEEGMRDLRVLVTIGGHAFEHKPFYAMLDALPGVTWKTMVVPDEAGMLKPGLEEEYDVILMYDMVGGIAPEHQKSFLELINRKIGLVSMHHNIGAHRDWEEWPKIVGGRWMHEKSKTMDGKLYLQTHAVGLNEPVTLNVKVDPDSPLGRGVKDFVVKDEFYVGLYIRPDNTPVLTTDHPEARLDRGLLGWTRMYNDTRVFYMRLGHFSSAYGDASWQKVMLQGLRWTACARHQELC
jgi:type 1 glutamine amidotransferase